MDVGKERKLRLQAQVKLALPLKIYRRELFKLFHVHSLTVSYSP